MLFGLQNAWIKENWSKEYTVQFTDAMHCRVSSLSLQVILKLFCLKLGPHSFIKFLNYD